MKKTAILSMSLILSMFVLSTSVWALSLQDAKKQGKVGETVSGYVAAVKPEASINALVQSINGKRKQKYQAIAKRNGTSLSSVEKLAGQKSLQKTPAGQFINAGSGWKKK